MQGTLLKTTSNCLLLMWETNKRKLPKYNHTIETQKSVDKNPCNLLSF